MTIIDLQWDGDKHRYYYRTQLSCHPAWLPSYAIEFILWLPVDFKSKLNRGDHSGYTYVYV